MKGRNKMSPDFGSCAMTAHPRQPVFILPEKVSASSDTTDVSPDMAARRRDTGHNTRNGILRILLSAVMLVKPSLVSARATQPQGPTKEPQKVEQSIGNKNELNKQLLRYVSSSGNEFLKTLYINNVLTKGADVNTADEYGVTPLHYATQRGNINIVKLLIAQGAHLDAKDNAGRTPLHYASGADSNEGQSPTNMPDVIRILLDNNAHINAQDSIGWTPLHYAAHARSKEIVQFLIGRGADIDVVGNRGRTPYRWIQERILLLRTRNDGDEATLNARINRFQEIAQLLKRSEYYVAISGRDGNPGTLELPFASMTAALEAVEPGDIVFIREGVYSCSQPIHLDKSGEYDKPISLMAYSGERPILDFTGAKSFSVVVTGGYWHLKGLVITGGNYSSIYMHGPTACHNILEQITVFDTNFQAILVRDGPAQNIILNCDSYNNFDHEKNGQNSDGFAVSFSVGRDNILIGNRSWNNSDDGFDLWFANNSVRLERCYAWSNGVNIWNHPFFVGNANGFKLGKGKGRHNLINCIAWKNPHRGFDLNANTEGVVLRNCTGWDNGINYFFQTHSGEVGNILRNNLSFEGRDSIGAKVDSQSNSWDADLVLTDNDFLSLDDSMMSAPRNPDGSIPQNNFLKLAPGSAAIDKGTDVGIPFVGVRPDLGAFEHDPNKSSQGYVKMLHQAVRDRDIKKIKELLAQGEGINDKDWLGYTPLQWAVYFGYPDVVELLLSQGADPDIQSDTGRFALEIAKAMVYADIEALLRKHGAKQ